MKWPEIILNGQPYGIKGQGYVGAIKVIQGNPEADSGCVIYAGSRQGTQTSLCTPEEAKKIIVGFCTRIIRAGGYIALPNGILDAATLRAIKQAITKGGKDE